MKTFADFILEMVGKLIYASRWMLIPLYLGLFPALFSYDNTYFHELMRLAFSSANDPNRQMLMIVDLLDIIMVANLVVMVAISGYAIFIREYDVAELGNRPRWFNNINSVTQKIKMSISLVAVTGIHLLHSFFETQQTSWEILGKQIAIHATFLISTIILCGIEVVLHPAREDGHTH